MADESKSSKDWFSEALEVRAGKPFERQVFVIMPFTVANDRGRAELEQFFCDVLKKPLESATWSNFGVRVSRSENKLRITDEIIRDIAVADYVVADLSGTPPNPNVMYELGVRLSLSTAPVVLIRERHAANQVLFDISTLHTFHYELNNTAALIDYLTSKIRAFENSEEKYISPVLQCVESGESVFKTVIRSRATRRIELLERELGVLVELYGNVVAKALASIGQSEEDLLEAIDAGETTLFSGRRYLSADKQIGTALRAPMWTLPISDLDDALCQILPKKLCDQVIECVMAFRDRFMTAGMQWAMDGPIASSLQLVRSAVLLLTVLAGARNLIAIGFEGPLDLDEQRRGWIAADHLQFVHDYGEFLTDLNRFRSRLIEWSSLPNQGRPAKSSKKPKD